MTEKIKGLEKITNYLNKIIGYIAICIFVSILYWIWTDDDYSWKIFTTLVIIELVFVFLGIQVDKKIEECRNLTKGLGKHLKSKFMERKLNNEEGNSRTSI